MKIKNIVAKFTSLLLVMVLALSMVACNDDSSKDDDEAENKGKEITVDELVENISSGETGVITETMIEDITSDDLVTYDEVEGLLKEIPSFKAEAEVKVDFYALLEAEGETATDDSFIVDGLYVLEFDNENLALHLGLSMDVMDETFSYDFWIVEEDDVYYMYNKENDDTAYRQTIGNVKEAFGEGLDLAELEAEMESDMEEFTELYEEMFAVAEDLTESELVNSLKDYISIKESNSAYNVVMEFAADKIIELALDSSELEALFEEADVDLDELVELLDEEITDGITVQDIVDLVNFDVEYSIDINDLFLTSLECDLSDCINDVCDFFTEYIYDMAEEQDVEDVKIELKCNDAYIKYNFEKDAKVNVEFDGDWEEYDDYYDDYDYYDSIEGVY